MRNWYCVYTKPKQEELVCSLLSELPDLEIFFPKMKADAVIRGNIVQRVGPLFPSYIFANFGRKEYFNMISYTWGVIRFVGNGSGSPYRVDDSIVDSIKSNMKEGLVQIDQTFRRGEAVKITRGALAGLDGIFLEELKPRERVIILLETIKSMIKFQVPVSYLERSQKNSYGHGMKM